MLVKKVGGGSLNPTSCTLSTTVFNPRGLSSSQPSDAFLVSIAQGDTLEGKITVRHIHTYYISISIVARMTEICWDKGEFLV